MSRPRPIDLNHAWFTREADPRVLLAIRTVCGAVAVIPMIALFWTGLS